jgi:hypothetical protein
MLRDRQQPLLHIAEFIVLNSAEVDVLHCFKAQIAQLAACEGNGSC